MWGSAGGMQGKAQWDVLVGVCKGMGVREMPGECRGNGVGEMRAVPTHSRETERAGAQTGCQEGCRGYVGRGAREC